MPSLTVAYSVTRTARTSSKIKICSTACAGCGAGASQRSVSYLQNAAHEPCSASRHTVDGTL